MNYGTEKVLYLLKFKDRGKAPYAGKAKIQIFVIGSITIKVNIERLERVIGKLLRNYFTLTIALMVTAASMTEIL